MRYLEGQVLCLEYAEYVREGIITLAAYEHQHKKGQIKYHGYGEDTLIEYESIPTKYKAKVFAKYGDVYEYAAKQPLLDMLRTDHEARQYFAEKIMPDGRFLPVKNQQIYSRQADWLNMIIDCLSDKYSLKRKLNVSIAEFWNNVVQLYKGDKIENRLPGTVRRLRDKIAKYEEAEYEGLIEYHRFGNRHAQLITPKIEDLILAIYAQYDGRTTVTQASKEYNAFIRGKKALVDVTTGELFNPEEFKVKGKLKPVHPASISNYINKKHNREAIDLMQLGGGDYTQKQRPHNRRHGPRYAFSVVSMDDYLPPFKTMDGKRTVWMYAIFDVASEAIVGCAYGVKKNWGMVLDSLADMARNCLDNDWGMPLELEMERSLNYEHRGSVENPDIFTAGYIFKHIRFVRGGNSQGKIVERFLGNFKYEQLARKEGFLGRPHGKNENYKYNKDKAEIHWEVQELINMLKGAVRDHNNQELKDGMSRWEWLCANMNPDCVRYQPQTLLPEVGKKSRKTSIYRGEVSVKGNMYEVPNGATDGFHSHKGRVPVVAYYLPDEQGGIDKVWLYQKGKYVAEGVLADTYNYSTAERTREDWQIMQRQTKKQEDFMKSAKERAARIKRVALIDNSPSAKADLPTGQAGGNSNKKKVRASYDKLQEEEEDFAEVNGISTALNDRNNAENDLSGGENKDKKEKLEGGNVHKTPSKGGGYDARFDREKVIKDAISSL